MSGNRETGCPCGKDRIPRQQHGFHCLERKPRSRLMAISATILRRKTESNKKGESQSSICDSPFSLILVTAGARVSSSGHDVPQFGKSFKSYFPCFSFFFSSVSK